MTTTKRTMAASAIVLVATGLAAALFAQPQALAQGGLTYSAAQAEAGKAMYAAACAACHGVDLEGIGPAGPLKGDAYRSKWTNRPVEAMMAVIRTMPPGAEPTRTGAQNAELLAFLIRENSLGAAGAPIPFATADLSAMRFPSASGTNAGGRVGGRGGGGPAPGESRVAKSARASARLDAVTPVTEAMLASPPAGSWINWRRTRDGSGFSPLAKINRSTVKRLGVSWSWSLPRGENMMTPLVHDGVLYAQSSGDIIEALDATTGELLWRHQRPLADPDKTFNSKKGIAIYGRTLLVPTSDLHVLALDSRTGAQVWDHDIDTGTRTGHQVKSAPIVAKGKVIIGINGVDQVNGGNFILAIDIATGKEAWRFYTIARPGEPGGNSWAGLPLESRTGGSVWIAGSYDEQTGLLYFGAAPTYAVQRLRVPAPGSTNEALYTNTTMALDPDTGKLVWHYQHQANDQLDHDWVFERQLIDVEVGGVKHRAVITAGKQAIYDVVDARTGKYLFSHDLGFQSAIASIDPATGAKILNPAAIPTPTQVLPGLSMPGICPTALGARNLMAAAYNPSSRLVFIPLTDTCLLPGPARQRWQKNPDPATDGQFGIVQAIDMQKRKVVWSKREVAPPVSGTLATGGGLVFVGDADRWFRAYDDRTGKELWKVRLDNVAASFPITYGVDGKQYLAVASNEGSFHARGMQGYGQIARPPTNNATLWVFALPDGRN